MLENNHSLMIIIAILRCFFQNKNAIKISRVTSRQGRRSSVILNGMYRNLL